MTKIPRSKLEISPITPEEYTLLVQLVARLAQDKGLVGDLTQEIAIYWMEYNPEKKAIIRTKGLQQAWFIRTILNQDRSKTSPFFRKFKGQPTADSTNIGDQMDVPYEEDDHNARLELIKGWIEGLFPSDKNIIKDYYEKRLTIMAISGKYGVDKNYTVSVLNRVKGSFRRRLIWRETNRGVLLVFISEQIAPLVGRKRLRVEERQFVLDAHNHLYHTSHNAYFDYELCGLLLKSLIQKLKL